MEKSKRMRRLIVWPSFMMCVSIISGCSFLSPEPPPAPQMAEIPEIVPEPVVVPEPIVVIVPQPVVIEEPVFVAPPQLEPIETLVAVVLSERLTAYSDVATALDEFLKNHEVYDLGDHSRTPKEAFAAIAESQASGVVAIGLRAAMAAKKFSTVPVVFSQVFNFVDDDLTSETMKGVAALAPIELHLDAWQELDPGLRNVGAILGAGHDDLIAETDYAMQARGIKFHYAIAASDKETLYLFNRLARDIDGFLLFPDNRILSRSVLDEIMAYASQHRVQVSVFNESLLDHGALFSGSSLPGDVAETIAHVLDSLLDDQGGEIPPVSGLSKIDIQTNPFLMRRYGIDAKNAGVNVSVADTQ